VKEYVSSVLIDAAPETVWTALVDGAAYKDWNPEIIAVEGQMKYGERIAVRVRLGSGAIRNLPMRITAFDAPRRMEWTGGLPLGLFVGRRTFSVTPTARGSEFRLHLTMSGPLSGPIVRSVGNRQPELDGFTAALKARSERR
jgi:uncharacterized protein YndB with AHSA1/START domain